MSRKNRNSNWKSKQKTPKLSNLQRFVLETAHLTFKDTIMLMRTMLNHSGHHAIAQGILGETGEIATYCINRNDANEDAQLQAQVDTDVAEGFIPMGFVVNTKAGSNLYLFPWVERACALGHADRETIIEGVKKAFKYANETEGHSVPLITPTEAVN